MEMNWSVFLLIQKPVYQALLFLFLTPVLVFVIRPASTDKAWLVAACSFAFFLVINVVMLWFDDSPWRYFFQSIGFAIVYLLLMAVIMPGLLKALRLTSSGESAMAFLIIIYQPIALLLVMLSRWIVNEWL